MNNVELHEKAVSLLSRAQGGDRYAEHDLIELIQSNYMNRRIGRYLSKNRTVDNDDIKQEFIIGVGNNINNARMDIGDPIEYLIYGGVCRVRSYFRKMIVQNTIQICSDCGDKSRINRVADGVYQCKKCGSIRVTTMELDDHDEIVLGNVQINAFEDDVISQLVVDDFKSTLTPGTNVYSLYELVIEQGFDRDNPMVKNYISAIAKEWGGTSNQNVVQNMKKLSKRLQDWLEKNQLVECSIM